MDSAKSCSTLAPTGTGVCTFSPGIFVVRHLGPMDDVDDGMVQHQRY